MFPELGPSSGLLRRPPPSPSRVGRSSLIIPRHPGALADAATLMRTNSYEDPRAFLRDPLRPPPLLHNQYLRRAVFRAQIERASAALAAEQRRLGAIKASLASQMTAHLNGSGAQSCGESEGSGGDESGSEASSDVEVYNRRPQRGPRKPRFRAPKFLREAKIVSRSQPSLGRAPGPVRLPSIEEETKAKAMLDAAAAQPRGSPGSAGSEGTGTSRDSTPPPLNNNTLQTLDGKAKFEEEDVVWSPEGWVVGGSLRALMKRLVPGREGLGPGNAALFPFLLNARALIAPPDLLAQLLQECLWEQNSRRENFERRSRTAFHVGVLRLCRDWAETFPWDFRGPEMLRRLNDLLAIPFSADPDTHAQSKAILDNLNTRLSKLQRYEKALENINQEAATPITPSQNYASIFTVCGQPRRIAEQLTHIELERLSMIGPEEFITALSSDPSGKPSTSGTSNIQHYVDWFNRLSFLVSSDVLRHSRRKHRVRALEAWVSVGRDCLALGNFNSLMAIVAALKGQPLSRLRRTWAGVETAALSVLAHQLDPSANFASYRATLKAATWRAEAAKDQAQRIVVPFFSLFVKDLLVLHQKSSRKLPNGHVNFQMWRQMASQIGEFLRWKSVYCPFDRDSPLLHYILTSPVFDETGLALASYECEAPENNVEKDQYKQLKLQLNVGK